MTEEKDPPCGEHSVRLNHLEAQVSDQWDAIEKLRNRPPIWATAVISLLTFGLGCALTYASLAVKLAGGS